MAIRYNVGSLSFDWDNNLIEVQSPQNTLSIQDLIEAIREAEASEIGMNYNMIATASGKEMLDSGVHVGVTVNLVNWQIKFWSGNYIAKIAGGNLVGGLGGDPVAYSAGVQVLLVQSAASTVVVSDGTTPVDEDTLATAVWSKMLDSDLDATELMRLMASALLGKVSGASSNEITFRDLADTKDRIKASTDEYGNRTNVTLDGE